MGTENIMKENGNMPTVLGSLKRIILVKARLKPNKLEPASPIIIFAGVKLYVKNPIQEPTIEDEKITAKLFSI